VVTTDHDYRLWIGGDHAPGSAGQYEIVNPATEDVVGRAPEASADDARKAAESAAAAFGSWSATAATDRAALLDRAADLLQARYDELVPLAQAETGGTTAMTSMANVGGAIARVRRYARGALEPQEIPLAPAPAPPGPLNPQGGLTGALAVRRPVGVVACITSYNVPLTNVVGKIGPALAMGNTVVIRPAPQDPLAVIRLVDVFHEAGFPPGVVNLVVGSTPESAEVLVASPHVDMVSFTGSTTVGRRIGEVAGGSMKRLLLELGGKGASIVFPRADLAAAAVGTASTFTFHAGQICTAPTRLIAHRSVYDEMVGRLAAIAGALKVGDPTRPDTVVGPVISAAQRERVEAHVKDGIDAGGEVVAGGVRPSIDKGFFVTPTLLAGCSMDMAIARQEIFGPVVVAMAFDDEDEAVAMANSTEFGLYDYVWSPDTSHALAVAARLRTGNVGLNTLGRNPETPFGGFKHSGVGRDGGSFALAAYGELQSVVWPG
jgi:acyl-CoA reductase-like NAD-dependent aldehyde dehydrogenase